MNYKYIIGSGCSFTESKKSWLNSFNIETKYNLSKGGCGNKHIQDSIIKQVYHLLEQGVSVDEILVGVQFTGTARLDFIASEETQTINNRWWDDFWCSSMIDENSAWIHSGGGNSFVKNLEIKNFSDEYFLRYYKYFMTYVENWYNFLLRVVTIQSFLKSNNIRYFFHTGWNLIDSALDNDTFVSNFVKFKQFNYLWNQIDHDKFIFYESSCKNITKNTAKNNSKYGGMWQYMIERDGISDSEFGGNDHPNEHGQKIWGEYLKETALSRNII